MAQVGLHIFYKFGHAHAPFQAQLFQAQSEPAVERAPAEIKPVLASLLPPGPAAEPAKVEVKAESASAESVKPVAQAAKPVTPPAKPEAPTV